MYRVPRRVIQPQTRRRLRNTLVSGAGANTTGDRGAVQSIAYASNSPYYKNNFLERYQEYVNLYDTSWEARKIIDIPVDDAMRQPTIREGLSPEDEKLIADKWEEFGVERQLRRCMKQERLLGGSVLLAIMRLQNGEDLAQPLNEANMQPGDLLALNVIDLSKLSRSRVQFDPFSADYDTVESLSIDGIEVNANRMVVFDGNALFGRNSQRLMQRMRFNPLGFGDSKLAPLWDVLMRSIGTQQAAYQLINKASMLLMTVENLRAMKATDSVAEEKLRELVNQLSIYNAALIDGKGVTIDTKTTSFGSVPELLLTFTQFLAAASDIPVTRFMGSSAEGMNATGEGDARNYYDMVDSMRNNVRKPAERRIIDWIGYSTYGYNEWKARSADLTLTYEPLWNLNAVEQATRDEIVVRMIANMFQIGMISADTAVEELNKRELFETRLEAEEALLDTTLPPSDAYGDANAFAGSGPTAVAHV